MQLSTPTRSIPDIIGMVIILATIYMGCGKIHAQTESDYAAIIHAQIGGKREVTVQSGRVDILTETHAYEIEWANKWKDAIGQALWYALQTNTKPGIILIMRNQNEYKYYIQLNTVLDYASLSDRVDVLLYPRDFKN